ncbi:MAG: DUF4419 domain-containing protein [Alphaproteobacteria bacterium]|nr:DUF4419 domain-containing protein [Alphaproteobacteria bacterium]MCB9795373.1 DUF4419 domain-containing protein [Alphaproteobacteria bacterium]
MQTAPLLLRAADCVRFAVDAVEPAAAPCETAPASALWTELLERPPLAFGDRGPLVPCPCPALLHGVARAFNEHRNLVLTPDAVWLTLAQGVARSIEARSEVRDKKTLVVPVSAHPSEGREWSELLEAFAGLLKARHAAAAELLICDFSTTDAVSRTASQVMLMSAYKRYYDYVASAICGIPEVELRGTVQDWRDIRARVASLETLGLGWWAEALSPVLGELVRSREGEPDLAFWKRIYKDRERYGGRDFGGWIGLFYPFQGEEGLQRNPMIADPGCLIAPECLPSALASADVHLKDAHGGRLLTVTAGLLGLAQQGLDLEPVSGWAVCEPTTLGEALHALAERAELPEVHVGLRHASSRGGVSVSADLQALLARLPGARVEGLQLRTPATTARLVLSMRDSDPISTVEATVFGELGPWMLAERWAFNEGFEVVAWRPERPGALRVVARGLAGLLAQLAEGEVSAARLPELETLTLPRPLALLEPKPGDYWDERPEDWQIWRQRVVRGQFFVRPAGLSRAQLAALRAENPGLKAQPLLKVLRELPLVERFLLSECAGAAQRAALEAKLERAGIPYEFEGLDVWRRDVWYRPSLARTWLHPEVLDAMVDAGVEVVDLE